MVGQVGQVRRDDRAAVGVGVRVAEAHDLDRAGPVRRRVVRRGPRRPHDDLVARQDPRGRLDVVLGVVAAADGVQLEQLAAEVLVGRHLRRVRVVEADAHGRVWDGGDQHLVEATQSVRADGAAVVGAEAEHAVVVDRNVQVVLEELGHRLQQLPPRAHPAQQAPALVVGHRRPGLAGHRLVVRPHRRRVPGEPRPPALEGVARLVADRGRRQLGVEPGLEGGIPGHLLEQRRCHPVGEPAGQVQGEAGRQPVDDGRLAVRTGRRRRRRRVGWVGRHVRLVLAVPAGARAPAGVLLVDLAAVPLPLRLRLPLLPLGGSSSPGQRRRDRERREAAHEGTADGAAALHGCRGQRRDRCHGGSRSAGCGVASVADGKRGSARPAGDPARRVNERCAACSGWHAAPAAVAETDGGPRSVDRWSIPLRDAACSRQPTGSNLDVRRARGRRAGRRQRRGRRRAGRTRLRRDRATRRRRRTTTIRRPGR